MINYNHQWGLNGLDGVLVFEPRSIRGDILGAQRQNYQLYIDELNMGSVVPSDVSNSRHIILAAAGRLCIQGEL